MNDKYKEATKEEYLEFISKYGRALRTDVYMNTVSHNDLTRGNYPQSAVSMKVFDERAPIDKITGQIDDSKCKYWILK